MLSLPLANLAPCALDQISRNKCQTLRKTHRCLVSLFNPSNSPTIGICFCKSSTSRIASSPVTPQFGPISYPILNQSLIVFHLDFKSGEAKCLALWRLNTIHLHDSPNPLFRKESKSSLSAQSMKTGIPDSLLIFAIYCMVAWFRFPSQTINGDFYITLEINVNSEKISVFSDKLIARLVH